MAEKKLKPKKGDNGKYGIVDKDGNWFLQPEFEKVGTWRSYLVLGKGDKWAIIDSVNGKWLDDREDEFYESVEEALEYDALELVTDAGDVWYLFDNGDLVPEYDIDDYEGELDEDEDEDWEEDVD